MPATRTIELLELPSRSSLGSYGEIHGVHHKLECPLQRVDLRRFLIVRYSIDLSGVEGQESAGQPKKVCPGLGETYAYSILHGPPYLWLE